MKELSLLVIYCLAGWGLCTIDPTVSYDWMDGIWHGAFFIPNLLRGICYGTPVKAHCFTEGYNLMWWLFAIPSTLTVVIGPLLPQREWR